MDVMSRSRINVAALPPVFGRADVLAAGGSPGWLAHGLRTGDVRRLRPGIYCTQAIWDRFQRTKAGRHALDCRAALRTITGPAYVALESAAALHQLPVLQDPTTVHLLRPTGATARHRGGILVDAARCPSHHVGLTLAVPTTSVARTVVDIARRRSLGAALVSGDAALRMRRVTGAQLHQIADELAGAFGMTAARSSIVLMDGLRESPLESQSVATIVGVGLPVPEPQVLIRNADGHVVARVDFLWRAQRVVGEVDGKVKYVGADASSLWREKRRQEAVEDAGYVVVRWGAAELADPATLDDRVRRGFARAARLRGAA